jgi:tetratricopeptide (TPR) repeat protein
MCFRYFVLSPGVKNITLIEMTANILRSLKATVWYSGIILLSEKILIFPEAGNIAFVKSLLSTSLFAALCVFLRKYYNLKNVLFGIFWFIFFIIPPYIMPLEIYFTHRLYLPIIGCLIVIFEIAKAASIKYPKSKNILLIAFCVLTVTMSLLSYKQAFHYQDRKSFWFKAYEEDPVSPQINVMMSSYYRDNGNTDKAQEHAFKALEYVKKQYVPRVLTEISIVYYKRGELDKAEEYFKKTIEANKLREPGYLGLSMVYEKQGDKQAAIDILTQALEVIPQSKSIKNRLDNLKNNIKEMSYTLIFKS